MICPWQETHLWLYQGHSFLIADSLFTCQWKCPCPNPFSHHPGSSQTSVKSSRGKLAPLTRQVADQSEQQITSIRQEFSLQIKRVLSRENIPELLPVLQTRFLQPCSEVVGDVGNSTVQVKFCQLFCAFCGVCYLLLRISMFVSPPSQLAVLMGTTATHHSCRSAVNSFFNLICFLKIVLSTNILTEVILILAPLSLLKKAKGEEHLEMSAHITCTNEGSISSCCS